MTERPFIVIDLDNTFVDYTTAFKECLTQMGYDGYADAPDPSDYSFACDDWFEDEDTFFPLHRRAVGLGLYLRERPYLHAPEALDDLHYGGFRIVLATSRYDDQEDTDRWLCGMGFEAEDWTIWPSATPTLRPSCATVGRLSSAGATCPTRPPLVRT